METFAALGALAASEGGNSMSILAPAQLPPGNNTWTAREVSTADQAFASADPSLLTAWLVTAGCVMAWKDATFDPKSKDEEEKETSKPEPK